MQNGQKAKSWIMTVGALAVVAGLVLSAWIHTELLRSNVSESTRTAEQFADALSGGDDDELSAREERELELLPARVVRWLLLGGGVVALGASPLIWRNATAPPARSDRPGVGQPGANAAGRPHSETVPEPRFCPECGNDAGGARFCSSCGARLRH